MIIQRIETRGIKELYTYFFELYGKDGKEKDRQYCDDKRSEKLLETVSVYFHIEDLATFEYFVLQNYIPDGTTFLSNRIIDEQPTQLPALIEKRHGLLTQIQADPDVSNQLIDLLKFPHMDRCSCIVYLTGKSLMDVCEVHSALNLMINWLGNTIQKVYQNENGGVDRVRIQFPNPNTIFPTPNQQISFGDYVASAFFHNFYQYYVTFFTDIDLVSDTYRYKNYFEGMRYLDCEWIDIVTPVGSIKMTGDPNIQTTMNEITEWYRDPFLAGSQPDSLIQLSFVTKISLYSFLLLARNFPHLVSDWTDLKIVLNSDEIRIVEIEGYRNYKVRIGQYLTLLDQTRGDMQKENFIAATNFISYGTPIACMLRGSLEEFDSCLQWMKDCIATSDELQPSTNDYLEIGEFKRIYPTLFSYSNTLRTLLTT